ncbi:uncharacterized protein LOC131154298 [Malania oleifera]|uniref:uncharacterized protein LOC131154298 n=1 Tax=Malania oleifera TaxID=397392 RepID=UPI0025ADA624|nr:uncharacterized protein LOC131154298 [Malania oleifera]XP_057962962.1 uncharacterized protein LOC131154298 [Malania oleifera]
MDGVGPSKGQKRRLPPWMLGVAAVDKVRKFENGDGSNDNSISEELVSEACRPKSKAGNVHNDKDGLLHDKEPLNTNPCVLGTKRRKRKLSPQDADCDSNIYEAGSKRKKDDIKGKVWGSTSQKARKAKSLNSKSTEEAEVTSLSEDDGELTMEDLMSIAEEYVKADEEIDIQRSSDRVCGSESELPAIAFSGHESAASHSACKINKKLPVYETAHSYNSTENLASEETVIHPGRTGDPTQDMLDLFLGPLLKKPSKHKKIDFFSEDVKISHEFRKPSQNKMAGEEPVPLMKKKSSLKDKVAMFLD